MAPACSSASAASQVVVTCIVILPVRTPVWPVAVDQKAAGVGGGELGQAHEHGWGPSALPTTKRRRRWSQEMDSGLLFGKPNLPELAGFLSRASAERGAGLSFLRRCCAAGGLPPWLPSRA